MRCAGCGTENTARARFCMECGAPFPRRCSHCGTELPDAAKFCMECAQPVTGAVQPMVEGAPRTYTPRHLAEKILASRSALAGERKQVTILFADIVGSTELIQGRDPEEAQALLDGVTRLMMDAVHRYEGTVSRLMGDGLRRCSAPPSRTRTTPSGPATRRWQCRRRSARTPTRREPGTASRPRPASGSAPARSWSGRSAMTCTWTTPRLRRELAGLQAAELLYEASLFPDLEYTFKHALTHEVAYGSLLQERRKTLHARVVAAIEQVYATRLDEQTERLADHAFRGEVWEQAVMYSRQAGVRAVGHTALREALNSFERALAALERLPETPVHMEQAIDIRLEY